MAAQWAEFCWQENIILVSINKILEVAHMERTDHTITFHSHAEIAELIDILEEYKDLCKDPDNAQSAFKLQDLLMDMEKEW